MYEHNLQEAAFFLNLCDDMNYTADHSITNENDSEVRWSDDAEAGAKLLLLPVLIFVLFYVFAVASRG